MSLSFVKKSIYKEEVGTGAAPTFHEENVPDEENPFLNKIPEGLLQGSKGLTESVGAPLQYVPRDAGFVNDGDPSSLQGGKEEEFLVSRLIDNSFSRAEDDAEVEKLKQEVEQSRFIRREDPTSTEDEVLTALLNERSGSKRKVKPRVSLTVKRKSVAGSEKTGSDGLAATEKQTGGLMDFGDYSDDQDGDEITRNDELSGNDTLREESIAKKGVSQHVEMRETKRTKRNEEG